MLDYSYSNNREHGVKLPEKEPAEGEYAQRLPNLKTNGYDTSNNSETSSESSTPEVEKSNEDNEPRGGKRGRKYNSTGPREQGTTKRARTLLTPEQSRVLHELLQQTCFPSTQVREAVAAKLGLSPRKVQVFFQNKRQKQRKKSNGAPVTSHSLVVPVYSSNVTREGYAEDEKYNDTAQRANYPPLSTATVREAPQPEQPRRVSSDVSEPLYRRTVSHSPENYMTGWTQRLAPTERHASVGPLTKLYDYRQRPSGFDTPMYDARHVPRPSSLPARVSSMTASQELAKTRSTVLPPILAQAEQSRSSQFQLPSINELISQTPGV